YTPSYLTHSYTHATTPTDLYTLSLHDALPIYRDELLFEIAHLVRLQSRSLGNTVYAVAPIAPPPAYRLNRGNPAEPRESAPPGGDRKSTRLNSSHVKISYAVFCLKKKTNVKHK